LTDALLTTLAEVLARLLIAMDEADEEDIDTDLCVTWFEDVASMLEQLTPADRSRFEQMMREIAAQEPDESRRAALLRMPYSLGLVDEVSED
jgi:hypothetical protein